MNEIFLFSQTARCARCTHRRLDAADDRRAGHALDEVVVLQVGPLGGHLQLGCDLRLLPPLSAVPQSGRNPVDRQLDPAQDLLVGILGAMELEQFDLNMVQRVEIGETVADRAFEQRIALGRSS